jgi:steroid delta-isomerase-like uncharacterized protein
MLQARKTLKKRMGWVQYGLKEIIRMKQLLMSKIFIIVLFTGLCGIAACNSNNTAKKPQAPSNSKEMSVTVETLKQILDAFNRHDLDAIMEFFSDDCSFDFPKGPEPWGQRFTGKAQVREALAGRFKGIPDVHYGEDRHWISADGRMGVSEWTLTGTTTSGVKLNVHGCDLWEFSKGKITRKNSYWKIVG